jgi:hypothetical protein
VCSSDLVPVIPGQKVLVSVDLTAPDTAGEYKGEWRLANASGAWFGTGYAAQDTFWVDIKVKNAYYFGDALCSAEWRNASGVLPCPSKNGDAQGYFFQQDNPKLEGNRQENEKALVMVPQNINNGMIVANYPPIIVPAKTFFRTVIGCMNGATSCNVNFKVTYNIGSGAKTTLL